MQSIKRQKIHIEIKEINDQMISFIDYCKDGNLENVKLLLKDKCVDPSDWDNNSIRLACSNGHIDVVKLLVNDQRVDPSSQNNAPIRYASRNGHLDIVKLLLSDSRVDPSDNNNQGIIDACSNGHLAIVKLLLTNRCVDPSDNKNKAIRDACENGHYEIVHLLLKNKKVQLSLNDKQLYIEKTRIAIKRNARYTMIPCYSKSFYEKYRVPDDVMHVILGKFCFGYTPKECMDLQNLIV